MTTYSMTDDPADCTDALDLLDALRSAIRHIEALHRMENRDCDGCYTCNRVLPGFRALVAKAEVSPHALTADGAGDAERMADEDERASAHLMAGYASSTCGEF